MKVWKPSVEKQKKEKFRIEKKKYLKFKIHLMDLNGKVEMIKK